MLIIIIFELFLILTINLKPVLNSVDCGDSQIKNANCRVNTRIVGGTDSKIGEFPWMASLIVERMGYCGSVIIHKRWILSAAHCLYPNVNSNQITVRIGSANKLQGVKIDVKNLFVHPDYQKTQRIIYDIALIELRNEIAFNISHVNSVCAPLIDDPIDRPDLTVFTGWGQTGIDGSKPTNTLKKAFYYTIPPKLCKFRTKYLICVNASQGVGCAGDSGSPLIRYDNCRAVLLGIFSYAERYNVNQRCGPALMAFIRISEYLKWIESITGILQNRLSNTKPQTLLIRPTEPQRFTYPTKRNTYSPKPKTYPTKPKTYPTKPKTYPPKRNTYPPKRYTYPPKRYTYPPKRYTYPSKRNTYSRKPYTFPPKPKPFPTKPEFNPKKLYTYLTKHQFLPTGEKIFVPTISTESEDTTKLTITSDGTQLLNSLIIQMIFYSIFHIFIALLLNLNIN